MLTTSDSPIVHPTTSTVRVVVYAHANGSPADQDRSLTAQFERLHDYVCGHQSWVLVRALSDVGTDRRGLAQAVAEAHSGTCDVLLVVALDRLARSIRRMSGVLDELERAGVAVRSTDGFDTGTTTGKLLVHMLGAMAEFERAARRRERTRQPGNGGGR